VRLLLHPKDLNISVMFAMMSVNNAQATPLCLGTVTMTLRDIAAESGNSFDNPEFRRRLDQAGLDGRQLDFLNKNSILWSHLHGMEERLLFVFESATS
jgi:hypothetical protein